LNQHAFSDVVTMMSGRDCGKATSILKIDKGTIAETTPSTLAPGTERSTRLDSQEVESDPEVTTQGFAELGVLVCLFAADAVVDVGRLEDEREVIHP
jgi:hypothetical protein